MWALEDAVRHGVRIRILSEGHITDAMPVTYASRSDYQKLLAMGVEIYEYQPTMMYTKVLVADGVWSVFGSANFDNRSLELNDELNVAVWDRDLAARIPRGPREGPPNVEAVRREHMAPPQTTGEGPRAIVGMVC